MSTAPTDLAPGAILVPDESSPGEWRPLTSGEFFGWSQPEGLPSIPPVQMMVIEPIRAGEELSPEKVRVFDFSAREAAEPRACLRAEYARWKGVRVVTVTDARNLTLDTTNVSGISLPVRPEPGR